MDDRENLIAALDGRVARRADRRAFFTAAFGAAAVGAALVGSGPALAQATPTPSPSPTPTATPVTDFDVLNFALNLEYLEANFYSFAVNGTAIPAASTTGTIGTAGAATGGRAVTFTDPVVAAFAREIAADELAHVNYLRTTIGSTAVVQPAINLGTGASDPFSTAARAAGIITAATDTFDPYLNDINFLLGAFIFEDVGVTAYKGASVLITSAAYRDAAAGILAVEAYHAATIRGALYAKGLDTPTARTYADRISDARDLLDGSGADFDQPISPVTVQGDLASNIMPLDGTGIAFGRTTLEVLNIAYLTRASVTKGGFFPNGVNGVINASSAAA